MRQLLLLILLAFADLQPIAAMSQASSQKVHITSEAIGVRTFQYQDAARKRPVYVELWYPADGSRQAITPPTDVVWVHPKETRDAPMAESAEKAPLILMSHGHRGDRRERSWLAEMLVRQGFVVASVEHFGNTWSNYHPLLSLRFWDRAKDVSFALDRILEEPLLKGRIDPERIGFVGYSMGGMTGLALAGAQPKNTKEIALRQRENFKGLTIEEIEKIDFVEAEKSYKEERIRSMVLICPANFIYPPESLTQIKMPIGLIAAVNDEVLPHHQHALPIIQYLSPQKLKLMRKEISHYTFLNRLTEKGRKLLQKGAPNDPPCCDRSSIHQEVGVFAIDFFKETLYPNNLKS